MLLTVLLVTMLVLLLARVPVAIALLIPSLGYMLVTADFPVGAVAQRVTLGINNFILLAVPMFVLMGMLANASGITERLYAFAQSLLGHIRGSLGYVNVFVSMVFSWMSGIATADAAGLSKIEVPAMRRAGYPFGFSAGISAASSIIGPIMPPSVPAVIYALAAGVSLGAMLLAGILPALTITLFLCAYVAVWARRRPHLKQTRATRGQVINATRSAALTLLTPVILLGGILGGVVTPTEAAGLAVLYVLLLGVIHRTLSLRKVWDSLIQTGEMTSSVLLIVASAQLFAFVLSLEQVPATIANFVLSLTESTYVFLLLVNITLLLMGMFLELASVIVIMVPVLLPVAIEFGIDPIQFGVIVVFNLMIGGLTPPIGLLIFVVSAALREPPGKVTRGVLPFLIPLLLALLVITTVPALSMWLPQLAGLGT